MPTALLVTADLGGNLPPLLGLARELRTRGWTVVVHGDEVLRPRLAPLGLPLEVAAGRRYDATLPRGTVATLRAVPAFWADRTRGGDAVAAARRIGADVAVVDPLLQGALTALERAGVPTAVVLHSTWEGTRAFLGGPVGALLRLRGVDPARALARADRVLVATDASLGRRLPMPANARVTGPVLEDPPAAPRPRTGRPLVLLSLSTVAFPGQRAVLQRLLDGVAGLPAEVRAATGRSVPAAGLAVGANTVLEERVDHGALLPAASAIVSHGGHATAVRALAHGVPLLLVPLHPLMDQPRIARAIAAEGAGLVLRPSASPARVRAAATRLLSEPAFAEAAGRRGARIRAADGAARAADEIEAVVGAGADTERPAAVPRDRPSPDHPDVSRAR